MITRRPPGDDPGDYHPKSPKYGVQSNRDGRPLSVVRTACRERLMRQDASLRPAPTGSPPKSQSLPTVIGQSRGRRWVWCLWGCCACLALGVLPAWSGLTGFVH